MFGLFYLEVYVSKLVLNKAAYQDSGGSSLVVRVDFIHFPPIEIPEHKRQLKENSFLYEFQRGQLRHFSMLCEEFVKKVKKIPVKIGVFRDGDSFPICQTRTRLTGCACDLGEKSVDASAPFTFKGPFDLLDPGDNFAGQLGVDMSITRMGRLVITHYALAPGCFLLKNDPAGEEYKCFYRESSSSIGSSGGAYRSFVSGDNLANTGNRATGQDSGAVENLMRHIAGISPAAERLALGRPPPKPPREPLVDPAMLLERRKTLRGKQKNKKKKGKKK